MKQWHEFTISDSTNYSLERAGALVRWLKLPAWKVGDRGF